MHVRIHEARQGISVAAINAPAAVQRFFRAKNPGDMTVDNADRSAYNRGAEHIDDLHIADHQVKGRLPSIASAISFSKAHSPPFGNFKNETTLF